MLHDDMTYAVVHMYLTPSTSSRYKNIVDIINPLVMMR